MLERARAGKLHLVETLLGLAKAYFTMAEEEEGVNVLVYLVFGVPAHEVARITRGPSGGLQFSRDATTPRYSPFVLYDKG